MSDSECVTDQDFLATRFVPFRLLGNRWGSASPTPVDWGPVKVEYGTHITLRYFDIDTLNVDGLLATLEQIYSRVIDDFGMEDSAPHVVVLIAAFDPESETSLIPEDMDDEQPSGAIEVWSLSPYVGVEDALRYPATVQVRGFFHNLTAYVLIRELAR